MLSRNQIILSICGAVVIVVMVNAIIGTGTFEAIMGATAVISVAAIICKFIEFLSNLIMVKLMQKEFGKFLKEHDNELLQAIIERIRGSKIGD